MKSHFLLVSVFSLALSNLATAGEPEIQMKEGRDNRLVFEISKLEPAEIELLGKLKADAPAWWEVLSVYAASPGSGAKPSIPAMLGTHRLEKNTLYFDPRFPLARGVTYFVVLHRSAIPGNADSKARIQATFSIPKRSEKPTAIVEKVYPSADKLPENQLKFYLHFSAPMSRGEAYRRVHLLDEKGKQVESPFLELGEELWDPTGKRFTLFFDPGRIKRGLKPREEFGPPLLAGKSYTLKIDSAWTDAEGSPLVKDFEKKFHVTDPIEEKIDIKKWKLEAPAGETTRELSLRFPRPLDHALLHRMIQVTGDGGDKVGGTINVSENETVWRFQPTQAWRPGKYRLVIDKALEDLAGNSLAAPFEVDVFGPIRRESKSDTTSLTFEVK
jgi:hypothetical protein